MGPAETTGIVIITVAIIQGLLKLVEHLINKYSDKDEENTVDEILKKVIEIEDKCGLNEVQAGQLKDLYDSHSRRDADGIPLWYVPRSWMTTQKDIIDRLQEMQATDFKMLGIIERLERRLETFDNRQN
jgi:hypothetical protein